MTANLQLQARFSQKILEQALTILEQAHKISPLLANLQITPQVRADMLEIAERSIIEAQELINLSNDIKTYLK